MDRENLERVENAAISLNYHQNEEPAKDENNPNTYHGNSDEKESHVAGSSSSASSVYSTAEEDLFEEEMDVQPKLPVKTSQKDPLMSRTWVTGSAATKKENNLTVKQPVRKTKSAGPSILNNSQKMKSQAAPNSLEGIPGAEINQLQSKYENPTLCFTSDDDDEFKSLDPLWTQDGRQITVVELQKIIDSFKVDDLSSEECERLIDILGVSQSRNDFQWALHQLGGCNTLLFLYARVVEICQHDDVQSKALSLALGQVRNHTKINDTCSRSSSYNLIRFILNNERCTFGFKTFIVLVHHCLTPSGNKLLDYDLLDLCLLSCWKSLIRVRCTDAEAPTGRICLFECLLTVILDLLLEKNVHRASNIALLKLNFFQDSIIFESFHDECSTTSSSSIKLQTYNSPPLTSIDAIRINSLVKSIFSELTAPADAYICKSIVRSGLFPLLPKENPPLPRRDEAFFIYHNKPPSTGREAEEEEFSENDENYCTPISNRPLLPIGSNFHNHYKADEKEESFDNVPINEDIPEIVGKIVNNGNIKMYNKDTFEQSQNDKFRETFKESLMEALMSVLLNSLAVISDAAFTSILRPYVNSHLFLAYCSFPNVSVKLLALKLLASYLSRVKNPCVNEFLKNKGFYLTALFIQDEPECASVVARICQGFGPQSYPLVNCLLHSNTMLSSVLEMIQNDSTSTVVPGLMSMGLIPSILNIFRCASMSQLPRQLHTLISLVIQYHVLNPKEEAWKSLFCPALESSYGCDITARFYQESIIVLKSYSGKVVKKPDACKRLLWLIERSSAGKFGNSENRSFDKWMLELYTLYIMELDQNDQIETELWKCFVKRNKKRLVYLFGVFIAKLFIPNKKYDETKQYTLTFLLQNCPNLKNWLPKVLKCDATIERCFTAFLRMFLCAANQKDEHFFEDSGIGSNSAGIMKTTSFQALLAEGNKLSLQLNSKIKEQFQQKIRKGSDIENADSTLPDADPDVEESNRIKAVDKAIREKFEHILVDAGILSPSNTSSTFSADFKNFKILLDTPPICGVSYQELRACLQALEKIRMNLTQTASSALDSKPNNRSYLCNAQNFQVIFEATFKFGITVVESVTRMRTQMGIDNIKSICTRERDITARSKWWSIMVQLSHPKAPWHFPEHFPKFWALDQCEGPSRVRIRLQREHLKIHNRFVLPKYRPETQTSNATALSYLFKQPYENFEELMSFPSIKREILYMRLCMRIIPGEEICGEIILSADALYFIPEWNKNQPHPIEHVDIPLTSVIYILRRRYSLEDKAVEIFVGNQSLFFTFKNYKDREEFVSFVQIKQALSNNSSTHTIMDSCISKMTNRWIKGKLSNFDYLIYLNTAAGRTYNDLMQYPVFPFVLAKYDSPTLDLSAPQSYRYLSKPMAIQDASKEEHFLATYNYLKRECDSAPFHYGSHYSNSGIVLHFLTRLPPYTQHFLKYQDGSFDIPDRSFHSMQTTWRLASRDSNTDFKEAIPELYYLPEFLQNLQHFDFGLRQNGTRVDDVEIPQWAKGSARLFTLINRQALESNHVRKHLCEWIDLIFGFKQTGKAAIMAINVFHPSTYQGFEIEGIGDELLKKARKAMVSTYGQTPKQLFTSPHSRSMAVSVENCGIEVLDTVWGIRWGKLLGSPTCPELEVVNTREYADDMGLFETQSRVVFWPKCTLIMGDTVVGTWGQSQIQIKSKVIYTCVGDEITTISTSNNSIWVGHHSGKITVLRVSSNLEEVYENFELIGHYTPIKCIDLNAEFSTAVSCSGENHAILWDMSKIAFINVIEQESSIDSVYSSRSTGDVVIVSFTSNRVALTTINGFEVGTVQPEEKVESACLSGTDPGENVNLLAVGCDYGYIRFYSTWDLKFIHEIKVDALASLPIQRYSKDGRRLYCLSTSDQVSISAALQLPDTPK